MTILQVRNISKSFGSLRAVDNIDLQVEEGQILGVIGPNGAGKTTLFNIIIGVYSPNAGEVIFKGQVITGKKPHNICRMGIAKTSQVVHPFQEMTVRENVLIGALFGWGESVKGAGRKVDGILEFVGLEKHRNHRAGNLTVPNRRRLDLARALATNPKIILLDENMAGLTLPEIKDALNLLRNIRDNGVTIIIIEHIMRAVMEISDKIMVLNYGQKIAEGVPEDIASNERVIEAYLGVKDAWG